MGGMLFIQGMSEIGVLVRLHASDTPAGLERSMESLRRQTRPPDRIRLIVDRSVSGPLEDRATGYAADHERVRLIRPPAPANRGGLLRTGVERAAESMLAILDCGDVAVPTRLAVQAEHMDVSGADAVGGHITEFVDRPDEPFATRTVPTDPGDIAAYATFRSPINHCTVCFDREAVLDVGNYRPLRRMEDYDLWMRMLAEGKRLSNLPVVLTSAHAGDGLYDRRGGLQYSVDEIRVVRSFYEEYGMLSIPELVASLAVRTPIRVLPRAGRKLLYEHVLRERGSFQPGECAGGGSAVDRAGTADPSSVVPAD